MLGMEGELLWLRGACLNRPADAGRSWRKRRDHTSEFAIMVGSYMMSYVDH